MSEKMDFESSPSREEAKGLEEALREAQERANLGSKEEAENWKSDVIEEGAPNSSEAEMRGQEEALADKKQEEGTEVEGE